MNTWLVVHAAATWAMVGFIWTIQLLVYPLMAKVPAAGFVAFERFHQQRVVAVLSVFAVVEVVSAGALALVDTGVSSWLWLSGGVVLVVLWVSTGAFYAPLHGRLSTGFDARLHRRLVMSNWVRTVLWSVRGVLAVSMLVAASS
ncbi:MAG: hypothetical protein ACO225_04605 [Ilumatobacteraceae bacterium]